MSGTYWENIALVISCTDQAKRYCPSIYGPRARLILSKLLFESIFWLFLGLTVL